MYTVSKAIHFLLNYASIENNKSEFKKIDGRFLLLMKGFSERIFHAFTQMKK